MGFSTSYQNYFVGEMLEGELYEIDSDGASKCPIRPCICDIALVVRQASLNIVIHAPPRPENSVTPPASLVVKVVGIIFYCLHFGSIKSEAHSPSKCKCKHT